MNEVPERIKRITAIAQDLIGEPVTSPAPKPKPQGGVLTLICPKCTRIGNFPAPSREEAYAFARYMGWSLKSDKAICKKCPN
jgi:hypothetical protein